MELSLSYTPLEEFLNTVIKRQFLPSLSKKITVTIIPSAYELLCVFIDPNKLGIVFGNLFSNAIKFTPVNGHIEISIDADPSDLTGTLHCTHFTSLHC